METKSNKSKRLYVFMISIAVLLGVTAMFYLIFNIDGLSTIFAPIVVGVVLAFLLNPILKFYEYRIFVWKKSSRARKNLCLACSIIMTFVTAAVILGLVCLLIIPQFLDSVSQLLDNYETYLNDFVDFVNDFVNNVRAKFYQGEAYEYKKVLEYGDIQEYVGKIFSSSENSEEGSVGLSQILESVTPLIQRLGLGIYDIIKNGLIGIFLAFYILISKDLRWAQMRKFRRAFLTPEQDEFFSDAMKITVRNFNGFIKGKIIDSLIIGLLTYVVFEVFNISEYNILNATIVGITNIVPVFGPIFGAIPVAFIVLISNPSKFLLTLILILVIQQIDGNIIGPKILGDSTNVSALTVIIAICTMGSILGVFGMIIGVPLFATIIAIVKKQMEKRLAEKGEPVDTEAYFSGRTLADPHKLSHKNEHTWLYRYEHSEAKVRVDRFMAKIKRETNPKSTKNKEKKNERKK